VLYLLHETPLGKGGKQFRAGEDRQELLLDTGRTALRHIMRPRSKLTEGGDRRSDRGTRPGTRRGTPPLRVRRRLTRQQ
jgi:hypothetical protein